MKNVLAFGLCSALIAATYGAASAATYSISVRNVSDTPIDFAIFQKDPSVSHFASQTHKQFCVQPQGTATTALDAPSLSNKLHGAGAETELVFLFKTSTCSGNTIDTIRLTESNPSGTYTITGTHGHYRISH